MSAMNCPTVNCRGCGALEPAMTDLDPKLDLPDDTLCGECFGAFLDWESPSEIKVKVSGGLCHPLAVDAWLKSRAT